MDELYVIPLSALVGLVAAWMKGYLDYSQTTKRELQVAALACQDRLAKLAQVRARLPKEIGDDYQQLPKEDARRKTIESEFYSLGVRLDNYLYAIGGARLKARRRHFPIYKDLRPVVIEHQFQPIGGLIKRLDEVTRLVR